MHIPQPYLHIWQFLHLFHMFKVLPSLSALQNESVNQEHPHFLPNLTE